MLMKTIIYENKPRTIRSLSEEFGIKVTTLHNRLFLYKWPIEKALTHKIMNKRHGCSRKNPEYNAWSDLKARCLNSKHESYKNYGARDIKVCDRWQESFENFIADMGNRPGPGFSIDRINNNGDYEPSNCRWATTLEQNNNKSVNRNITYLGETHTITEWGRLLGFKRNVLDDRLKNGLSIEEAFNQQVAPFEILLTHNNKTQHLTAWAQELGVSCTCISSRLKKGWSIEKTLTTVSVKKKIFQNGKYYTKTELAKEFGLTCNAIRNRINKGMSMEKALSTPKWKRI